MRYGQKYEKFYFQKLAIVLKQNEIRNIFLKKVVSVL